MAYGKRGKGGVAMTLFKKTAGAMVPGPIKAAGAVASTMMAARGAARAGTAIAKSVTVAMPGGGKMRPLAATPGGVKLFEGPRLPSKRRRMDAGNTKALKRAIRRTDAFINLAKSALKGSPYHITRTKSSSSCKKGRK